MSYADAKYFRIAVDSAMRIMGMDDEGICYYVGVSFGSIKIKKVSSVHFRCVPSSNSISASKVYADVTVGTIDSDGSNYERIKNGLPYAEGWELVTSIRHGRRLMPAKSFSCMVNV